MSSYSTNLKLELIGTGQQAGTWGNTTNTNLGTLIEQAIAGYESYACTGGTDTLTMDDGASSTARNMFIRLTGTGGGTLVVPGTSPNANTKLYYIQNATASGAVTVKVSGQTGVSVPNGAKTVLFCNGTDIIDATSYMSALSLGAALPVTSGGTGVTTSTGTGNAVLSASPTLTGAPLAPTATAGTNTTQIATTAFVQAATTALGLGTMSTQNANAVAITGGTVSGLSSLGVSGTATATTFSGAGTSLTGTAASLTVGNATNATNATTSTTQSNGDNTTSIATTAYVQNMGLGWGQTWQNVAGSRSAGTTYTNSTGKPIMVVIGIGDDNSNSTITVGGVSAAAFGYKGSGTVIVPNGTTYSLSAGPFSLWSELR